MKADIYNQKAEKVGDIELNDSIFNLPWNANLVHQVVVSMQSNQRQPWAHTKTRGEVSGGGKKPWRQKGLGRARHGSIRSPIWVGGGIAHGPRKDKDYSRKINAKMKKKALFTVLSQKVKDSEILFVDGINLEKAKTKEAANILNSMAKIKGFEKLLTKKKNKAVVALGKKEEAINRGFRNIPGMTIAELRNINILDILNNKYLIISNPKEALSVWE
ncbi:MAG: 50S ribosomal protein L4 [Candidatus Pacebacteria bacterium]|nr:50S ribosomal protein L4 [Candidatus Paceibacterota bacterium]NUQ57714.1 50S ribosomal protein L4 [Candidatus Paceibacter sp.]